MQRSLFKPRQPSVLIGLLKQSLLQLVDVLYAQPSLKKNQAEVWWLGMRWLWYKKGCWFIQFTFNLFVACIKKFFFQNYAYLDVSVNRNKHKKPTFLIVGSCIKKHLSHRPISCNKIRLKSFTRQESYTHLMCRNYICCFSVPITIPVIAFCLYQTKIQKMYS